MSDWMNVEEIASELGVSRNTVYRALELGQLPARRVSTRWLVRKEWMDRWLRGEPGFWSGQDGSSTVVGSPFVRRLSPDDGR